MIKNVCVTLALKQLANLIQRERVCFEFLPLFCSTFSRHTQKDLSLSYTTHTRLLLHCKSLDCSLFLSKHESFTIILYLLFATFIKPFLLFFLRFFSGSTFNQFPIFSFFSSFFLSIVFIFSFFFLLVFSLFFHLQHFIQPSCLLSLLSV